jgi:hypothetical protein
LDISEIRKQFRARDGRFSGYLLSRDDDKTIRCPFCGAPYRKIIPSFTAQLVCDYCGATFRTPPSMGVEVPRCQNHPERYAVGKCNDCGGEFCNECLQTYDFDTRDGHALLYLCPDCLENRETNKLNSIIFAGILLFLAGFVALIAVWPIGILFIIGGAGATLIGATRKTKTKATISKPNAETEETQTASETDWEEADKLYGDLIAKYAEHWGISTGAQLLEDEIKAYTWHGDSWPDAVRKVYRNHRKRTSFS